MRVLVGVFVLAVVALTVIDPLDARGRPGESRSVPMSAKPFWR